MRKKIAAIGMAIAAAIAIGSAALAVEVKVEKNIVYSTVGKFEIKGNMMIPEGKGPFAGILYIHGGGFVAGSKDFEPQSRVARFLAENGFLVFAVDYRLIKDGGIFPNCTKDVKCALCWFKKNGVKYGLDPKRVGVLGESAGGYLAAMLALTGGMPEFAAECPEAEKCDDSVVATVAVFPPSDFATFNNNLSRMVKNEMIKAGKIKDKALVKKYMVEQSPITYVKNATPILIFHGVNDILVPVEQSRTFSKALKDAGKDVEYVEFEDAPHGFFSEKTGLEATGIARKKAVEFFKARLAPAK
ncbi:MAG: alpha/beta hydrolase fold domain-containing protein [bacterium]